MKANQAELCVRAMCKTLRVSPSGYYDWLERPACAQAQANAVLLEQIRQAHVASDATYGVPRIQAELADKEIKAGHNRIASVMRANGLRGVSRRRAWCVTTKRDKDQRPAPDLVQREFTATGINQLWVADMTYIPTWAGFVYLAVVIDVYSRKVVGWAFGQQQTADLVVQALNMALITRKPQGVIHHSDQGSQGEFNLSSQHFLIGGVYELEEVEVRSIAACEAPLARQTASVASIRAMAVLEGDLRGALQRGRRRHRWRVAGRGQQMVPTMRRYATIESCTVRTRADRPLPFLRRA